MFKILKAVALRRKISQYSKTNSKNLKKTKTGNEMNKFLQTVKSADNNLTGVALKNKMHTKLILHWIAGLLISEYFL